MMTREEAIEILENGMWWELLIPITTIEGRESEDKLHQAIDIAVAALTPPTQEEIERLWRAHNITNQHHSDEFVCDACGLC
mgnify:CR=1 FL=1